MTKNKQIPNSKKKSSIWSLIIAYGLFLVSYLLFISPVFAQQINLSISPPHLEVVIKPGKSILVAYTVQNLGDPVVIIPKVLPFVPKDNQGNITIQEDFEGPIRFALDNADLQLDKPFFLKSQAAQQLLLRMRIPDGAPEWDYYYTFFVETQPFPGTEGVTSSQAQARIGSNILATVTQTGVFNVKGRVAFFDVIPRFKLGKNINIFDSSDQIPIVLILENNGKNLFKPEGNIVLSGIFGEKAKYDILPQNILAGSQRVVLASPSAQLNCDLPKNNQEVKLCQNPLSLLLSGFFAGRYTLSAEINFGDNSPTNFFASTSFIGLPFKFLLGLLVVIIAAVILVRRLQKD